MPTQRLRTAALVLAAMLIVTGCGGDAADAPSEARTAGNGDVFNDDDVEFAKRMIPHHADVVGMVVLAQGRPLEPAVRELADAARDAHVVEVETMVDWLTAWGEPIPETSLDHANSGHGADAGAGVDEELAEASDADFQELWLQHMIDHHEAGIDLAKAHQELGVFRPGLRLADRIVAARERAVVRMEQLLSASK